MIRDLKSPRDPGALRSGGRAHFLGKSSAAEPKTDEKKPANKKIQTDEKKLETCTDCHDFEHKLKNRTRRWNKETRKIEWFDGVRMMQSRDQK